MANTEDVFVTEGVPNITFIEPPGFSNIVVDLRSPTRSVVFEGASGTGKTTAIKKGLEAANIPIEDLKVLSGRDMKDVETIKKIMENGVLPSQFIVIDDYHRLDEITRKRVSDLLKISADTPGVIGGKLIVAGINEAGRQLIEASPDLLKRIAIHKIKPAGEEKAIEALKRGAEELNIVLHSLQDIYNESEGDYWTMQKLCQQACIRAGILESHPSFVDVKINIIELRQEILSLLEVSFKPTIREFSRGKRFRRTNRPYLSLLECFSKAGKSTAFLNDLGVDYPDYKPRLDSIKKHRLPGFLDSKPDLKAKFYYDPLTTMFSVEDPALAYYIKRIDWQQLAIEFGFTVKEPYIYDIAVSFSGEERALVQKFIDRMKEEDVNIFYDEDFDAQLLGKDLEDEFQSIYGHQSKLVVVFISESYRNRVWPSFERNVWKVRVKSQNVIPIFIDFTIIKEISDSIGRIDFYQWTAYQSDKLSKEDFQKHFEHLCKRILNVLEE